MAEQKGVRMLLDEWRAIHDIDEDRRMEVGKEDFEQDTCTRMTSSAFIERSTIISS